MGYLLDANTSMSCPHGGQVTVKPGKTKVTVGDPPQALYVLDDFEQTTPAVSGCGFNISGSPSPCRYLRWLAPSLKVTIEKSPALLSSSVALCLNDAQLPQGKALVTGFQTKVEAL